MIIKKLNPTHLVQQMWRDLTQVIVAPIFDDDSL